MSDQRRTSIIRDSSSPEVDVVRAVKQEPTEESLDDLLNKSTPKESNDPQTIAQGGSPVNVFDRLLPFCCAAIAPAVKYTWLPILASWFAFVFVAGASYGWGSLQGALSTHIPSVCHMPFVPTGLLCVVPAQPTHNHSLAVDFPQLMKLEATLLQAVFEESAGVAAGIWDMNRAHLAAGSLQRLIKASDFPSKDLISSLITELETKLDGAGVALRSLHQEFEFCVQSTINVNDFALRTIEADRGTFLERHFPGYSGRARPIVQQSFGLTLDVLSECLGGVFIFAEDAAMHLGSVNVTIDVIHGLNSLHGASFARHQEELSGTFWTFLGGNRQAMSNHQDHLLLVGEISNYRAKSATHVHRTTHTVLAFKQQLVALRDSVTADDGPYPDMSAQNVQVALYHIRATMALAMDLLTDSRSQAERLRSEALCEARTRQ